jgi:hypothetical protein
MPKVVIVLLRRPRSRAAKPEEMRSDPFWEFGSFGITTCHRSNLMHPKNIEKLKGARFAFAQGGKQGTRLVYLTPPVAIVAHHDRIEATWLPKEMPFRYDSAPILVSNSGWSQFPKFAASTELRGRTTLEGQFSSNFRGRATCIADGLANELIDIYTKRRRESLDSEIARSYEDALPWLPPLVDRNRERTYTRFLKDARGSKPRVGCGSRKRRITCSPNKRRGRRCSA